MNFWDPEILTKEGTLTREIFDEAKNAGVKHVIYSGLANVAKISRGKLNVPHFTLKAEAWDYLKTMGFDYVTDVEPAAYYSNWFSLFKPKEEEDGTLVWTWPGVKKDHAFSQFDVSTGVGPAVLAAAKDPVKYQEREIILEGDKKSFEECVALVANKMGKSARVEYIDPKVFSTFFEGAEEIVDMVKWFEDYGYFGPETETRKHGSGKEIGGLLSFQEWLDTDVYKKLMQ
ncbi:hypothetical protein ACA910_013500 [Epithemia clementina (nom. ined.)]